MKKSLFIYGAGGLGREVLSLVKALPEWQVVGFIDDSLPQGTRVSDVPVHGGISFLNTYPELAHVAVAIGDPAAKKTIVDKITNPRIQYPTLIHPTAILQDMISIVRGKGAIICAGVTVTNDVSIGDFTLINLNCTIGHDVTIGAFSSLMPSVNLAGNVQIGNGVLIGSGANLRNDVSIGNGSIVGMGSVVLNNVDAGKVVAGVPAKPIR
jgi:sugar O-acyltransferase (sialic acid O-acetyltransferase NeuD family)